MIEVTVYLDKRRLDKQDRASLKLRLHKHGKSATLGTGVSVLPDQWDGHRITNHPDQTLLNSIVGSKLATANRIIIEKTFDGSLAGKTASEIMRIIREGIDPEYAREKEKKAEKEYKEKNSFLLYFRQQVEKKMVKESTKGLYMDTLRKIEQFLTYKAEKEGKDVDMLALRFSDINKDWLAHFEEFCLRTQQQNTTSRHLRDIRAIFNCAIDDCLATVLPFRKFKIKVKETVDKHYTAEELRRLFDYPCYLGGQQKAVDVFKLMFCLIGINSVDLANAQKPIRGRLEYDRAKTGKHYSIRIEPEAQDIIKKYKGETHLLDIIERYPDYKTYFNRLAKTLKKVGLARVPGKKSIGAAILPNICTGSARTSWSTIAQDELSIPREVIAAALGHHTVDVSSTYLRTDWRKKVDEANRKVLDWVFHGQK